MYNKKYVLLNQGAILDCLIRDHEIHESLWPWLKQVYVPHIIRNCRQVCWHVLIDKTKNLGDYHELSMFTVNASPMRAFRYYVQLIQPQYAWLLQNPDVDVYFYDDNHPAMEELGSELFDFLDTEARMGINHLPRDFTRMSVEQMVAKSKTYHDILYFREQRSVHPGKRLELTHDAFPGYRLQMLLDKQAYEHESCIQRNCVRNYWHRHQDKRCRVVSVLDPKDVRYTVETVGSIGSYDFELTVLQVKSKCNESPELETRNRIASMVAQTMYVHDRAAAIHNATIWQRVTNPIRSYLGLAKRW